MYVFQIRAFTAAGYGNYSPRLDVATLEEATGKMFEGNYHLDLDSYTLCFLNACIFFLTIGDDDLV